MHIVVVSSIISTARDLTHHNMAPYRPLRVRATQTKMKMVTMSATGSRLPRPTRYSPPSARCSCSSSPATRRRPVRVLPPTMTRKGAIMRPSSSSANFSASVATAPRYEGISQNTWSSLRPAPSSPTTARPWRHEETRTVRVMRSARCSIARVSGSMSSRASQSLSVAVAAAASRRGDDPAGLDMYHSQLSEAVWTEPANMHRYEWKREMAGVDWISSSGGGMSGGGSSVLIMPPFPAVPPPPPLLLLKLTLLTLLLLLLLILLLLLTPLCTGRLLAPYTDGRARWKKPLRVAKWVKVSMFSRVTGTGAVLTVPSPPLPPPPPSSLPLSPPLVSPLPMAPRNCSVAAVQYSRAACKYLLPSTSRPRSTFARAMSRADRARTALSIKSCWSMDRGSDVAK
ncbi:hypothetical protein MCOR02_012508 [Pyricularia oryzae]|nr:hypothetical protein MCOR02_012508 [Pyricularia oryzae]